MEDKRDRDRSGAAYNERRNSDYKRGARSTSARDHKEFERQNDNWRRQQAQPPSLEDRPTPRDDDEADMQYLEDDAYGEGRDGQPFRGNNPRLRRA